MKNAKTYIEEITEASDNNEMMRVISLHDQLITADISVATKVMSYLKKNEPIVYMVVKSASSLSKVEKNGVFNRIIRQSIAREMMLEVEND